MPLPTRADLSELISDAVADREADLVRLRRDLHAHPELAWHETRTTDVVAEQVERAGWRVHRQPGDPRVGLVADLGDSGPLVAIRADMDALPVDDLVEDEWRSTVPGVAHACGHDVHTAALVGAAWALAAARDAGRLDGRLRLLFQPAEEVMPGGARRGIGLGVLEDVVRIFALHCEPALDVGQVGLRVGALTSAADRIDVQLHGSGGHTSRPHLTGDLTFALAKVVTELSAVMSRRMDPRAGVSVVWGAINAGTAPNVIPGHGRASGTIRILDAGAWADCERIVRDVVADVVRPYGVRAELDYQRGVPPVVNEVVSVDLLRQAAITVVGEDGVVGSPQSLGGEDFGWYLERVPGAMLRLGTRTPGGTTYDLHQGNLRVDERAVALGARLLSEAALAAIALHGGGPR